MDQSIGRIFDTVSELGLAQDTLVFFWSDNGDVRMCPDELRPYPPDLQEEAVKTVLAQAELLCAEWV